MLQPASNAKIGANIKPFKHDKLKNMSRQIKIINYLVKPFIKIICKRTNEKHR